jgi:UTP-glucose-1-phosphate uridylyltransferase
MGPGPTTLSPSMVRGGIAGEEPRKRRSCCHVRVARLVSWATLPAHPAPGVRGHPVVVPDRVDGDSAGGPGHGTQQRGVEEEGDERHHLSYGHGFAPGPGRNGPRVMGNQRGDEGDGCHDVTQQYRQDLVELQLAGECDDTESTSHEELVGDGVDHRSQSGAAEPPGQRSVEEIGEGGAHQYYQTPGGTGYQHERNGQRDPEKTDDIRRRPPQSALLGLPTRTSFGHAAPLTERERTRYSGPSSGPAPSCDPYSPMMLDTAVIPCGGLGTRLHPITRWLPKEVLPVGLKPVLYWTLDEAADAGLLRAIIITNPHKPMLEAVARNYPGPLELEFVPQDHPRGLGDALLRARDPLAGSPFLALLPDNLFQGPNPTAAVLATFRSTGLATVLLAEIGQKDAGTKGATGRAAVRQGSDGTLRVVGIADKGAGRFDTAGAHAAVTPVGRMAFRGDVLEEFEEVGRTLPSGAELDDVPVMQRLARREALAGVISQARFFDVGVPEGYREAVAASPARA